MFRALVRNFKLLVPDFNFCLGITNIFHVFSHGVDEFVKKFTSIHTFQNRGCYSTHSTYTNEALLLVTQLPQTP